MNGGGSDYAGFADLSAGSIRAWTLVNGTTLANVADAEGNADAGEFTTNSTGGTPAEILEGPVLSPITVGLPVWVEFDLKQGSATPLALVNVVLRFTVGTIHWQRTLTPPAAWTRYRYLTWIKDTSAAVRLWFDTPTQATGKVQIGRVRVYHAREPQPYSVHTRGGVAPGSPALLGQSTNAIYMGSGAPANANGNDGDRYYRTDLPGAVPTRDYIRVGGVWVPNGWTDAVQLTDAGTIATDASLGGVFFVLLAGNRTMGAPTNPKGGQEISYIIVQTAGANTLAWNAAFKQAWSDVGNTANKRSTIRFAYLSGSATWSQIGAQSPYF